MEPNWIEIEKQAKTWLVEAGNKIKKKRLSNPLQLMQNQVRMI